MNHIKSLASQTAIYGVSSIIGRLLNYLLIPLHTGLFSKEELGPVTYLYSLAALLLILYTHGMETTFFRFSSKSDEKRNYRSATTSVLLVSAVITLVLILFSNSMASFVDYPGQGHVIRWLAIIIFIDAVVAIPFAKMRLENRAKQFVLIKFANIVVNVSLQLLFLIAIPGLINLDIGVTILSKFQNPAWNIEYIFLANLVANLILIPILWPQLRTIRFRIDSSVLPPMWKYAYPLLLTGIAGWITEQFDKILVKEVLSFAELGVYGQVFKLAVFIQLAIQAFRYAAEPFFFSRAKDPNAPRVFSDVLYYYVVFGVILLVAVCVNLDLIGRIMLQRPEYRVALYLVPVIMFGKFLYGVYINIAIWFKIKDRTIFGAYFTLLGSVVTIAGNLILLPIMGYDGSALTIVLVYASMTTACYFIGKRYFPVPYRWLPMTAYTFFALLIIYLSMIWQASSLYLDTAINLGITFAFIFIVWRIERGNFYSETS